MWRQMFVNTICFSWLSWFPTQTRPRAWEKTHFTPPPVCVLSSLLFMFTNRLIARWLTYRLSMSHAYRLGQEQMGMFRGVKSNLHASGKEAASILQCPDDKYDLLLSGHSACGEEKRESVLFLSFCYSFVLSPDIDFFVFVWSAMDPCNYCLSWSAGWKISFLMRTKDAFITCNFFFFSFLFE